MPLRRSDASFIDKKELLLLPPDASALTIKLSVNQYAPQM